VEEADRGDCGLRDDGDRDRAGTGDGEEIGTAAFVFSDHTMTGGQRRIGKKERGI